MTPEIVFRRLRLMGELSSTEISPMPSGVDMSPRSVALRLREMSDVSELCAHLATGRMIDH